MKRGAVQNTTSEKEKEEEKRKTARKLVIIVSKENQALTPTGKASRHNPGGFKGN